jgi:uncharacterized protein
MRAVVVPLAAGLLLGAGLVLGRLTRAETILGLFDLERFDPTMLLFWASAIATLAGARRRLGPGPTSNVRRRIDRPLLLGSAIFGVGWGLAGVCPGPALAGLATLAPGSLLFFAAMLLGNRLAAPRLRSR